MVIGGFATSGIVFLKMIGVGMLVAVLLDATVVRALLVPATMRLLGRANWWAPGPLAPLVGAARPPRGDRARRPDRAGGRRFARPRRRALTGAGGPGPAHPRRFGVMTDTVALHHLDEGQRDAPPVLLGASLGTTHRLWDELAADLAGDFRVVRFDTRGHGASPAPAAAYTVEGLVADVLALADHLSLERFAYVGLSLGGAIGQVLGVDCGDRLTSLVLCCTAPVFGTADTWRQRAEQVRAEGVEGLVDATLERWFTPDYQKAHPDRVAWVMDMLRATPPDGYAGCCDALANYDIADRLAAIATPTLVVAGADDPGTPPSVGAAMVEAIPGSRLQVVDDAAHIANVAQPDAFNTAVRAHLAATLP